MGQGDKKIPYVPPYEPVYDDVLRLKFASVLMRKCPNEKVIERYGTGGVANVSIYVCYRCKYARRYRFHGGIGCSYGLEKRISSKKKNND